MFAVPTIRAGAEATGMRTIPLCPSQYQKKSIMKLETVSLSPSEKTLSDTSTNTVNKADTGESNNECAARTTIDRSNVDTQLLYSLVQAEAGNQDLDGCRLVADVVLNRIDSSKFPNDLESVVYAPGQFSVVRNGALKKAQGEISPKVVQAVDMELTQARLNYNVLYFNNRPNGSGCWQYGGHWFR